jgi:hypothetical protein
MKKMGGLSDNTRMARIRSGGSKLDNTALFNIVNLSMAKLSPLCHSMGVETGGGIFHEPE